MRHDVPRVEIDGLCVDYRRDGRWHRVIDDVSLSIWRGEALGLVGESGCGKSTLVSMLLGERLGERRIGIGTVRFDGRDLFAMPSRDLRRLRGRRIGIVPQNPGMALTPSRRIDRHFDDLLRAHGIGSGSTDRRGIARDSLARVGIPDPTAALSRFPHQFSGGQQQRIALALALGCEPDLLVLDEPTTGQDALIRHGLLELLRTLRGDRDMTMLYVTHDLATLEGLCDRIAVMHAGRIVETGPLARVLDEPRHPYTRDLLAALPRLDRPPRKGAAFSEAPAAWTLADDGCRFAPRCRHAEQRCAESAMPLEMIRPDHTVACRRWAEIPFLEDAAVRPDAMAARL